MHLVWRRDPESVFRSRGNGGSGQGVRTDGDAAEAPQSVFVATFAAKRHSFREPSGLEVSPLNGADRKPAKYDLERGERIWSDCQKIRQSAF